MRAFVLFLLMSPGFLIGVVAYGQLSNATDTAPPPVLTRPAAPTILPKPEGVALPVVSDVESSVTVDAVLLPSSVARRIFGKVISDHYAVVQMTISNHNQDAALIIQSALLDYSHWLFSNNFQAPVRRDKEIVTTPFQSANNPSQVASTEARLVRGNLQDAQYWTARNSFIRAITAVGTIASAFQFLAPSQDYSSGISAFGNQVVPALATFWPDQTPQQLNRINDFGFQTNHVVAKGSSDIVVAFFPLDRFLTPTLRDLFIKSPAIFFVPGQMLIDAKYRAQLASMLRNSGMVDSKMTNEKVVQVVAGALSAYEDFRVCQDEFSLKCPNLKDKLPENCKERFAEDRCKMYEDLSQRTKCQNNGGCLGLGSNQLKILGILDKISLNNIRVVIGGIMTIDTNAVPATIDDVALTEDPSRAETWKSGATVHGTVTGTFLSGGVLSIVGGKDLGIGDVVVDTKNSTDKKMFFQFDQKKDIPSDTKLQFVVTKRTKEGSATVSRPFELTTKVGLGIDSVTIDDASKAATWKSGTTLHGVIAGSSLAEAVPSVDDGAKLGIGSLTVDAKNTTDKQISFSSTLTKDIPSGTKLQFVVTKTAKDGTSTATQKKEFEVKYETTPPPVDSPKIDSVTISDSSSAATWKSKATVHAVIAGSSLSGGVPSVVDGAKLGIGSLTVDAKNTTDKQITFSSTLTNDIPSGTKLQFVVTKTGKDGSPTVSAKIELEVKY